MKYRTSETDCDRAEKGREGERAKLKRRRDERCKERIEAGERVAAGDAEDAAARCRRRTESVQPVR